MITAGGIIEFRLTGIRNPPSFTPTDTSIIYKVSNKDGVLVEDLEEGLIITNTEMGVLSYFQNGLIPATWVKDDITSYTLSFFAKNFVQNMKITITLPEEIDLPSKDVTCLGELGTNTAELNCTVNLSQKTVSI